MKEQNEFDEIKTARKAWKPATKGLKSCFESGILSAKVDDVIVIEYPTKWRDSVIGSIVSMQPNGDFFVLEQGGTSHTGCNWYTGTQRGIKFYFFDSKTMRLAVQQDAEIHVKRMGPSRGSNEESSDDDSDADGPKKRGRPRKNPV